MLYGDPCVFAVGREYQIVLNTLEFGVAWVEVNGKAYRDSRNGLVRSETLVHKVFVPMTELDAAKAYRVCFRALPERRPYYPELGDLQTREYAFRPVDTTKEVRAYMLADTHSRIEEPCRAAAVFGDIDLLIMNGDIPAESKCSEDIRAIFDLTSRVTHGQIPVVFARGNHDCRGRLATDLPDYIGTDNGNTWFTFRLGSIWGIVVDCGEDKEDDSIEYGGLVDCHDMRLRETAFLKDVIARANEEYLAPGVTTRIALCHVPFTTRLLDVHDPKFNIEKDTYAEWTALLNRMDIDLMLCGHMHMLDEIRPGDELARESVRFPVIVGSAVLPPQRKGRYPQHPDATFICTGLTIREDSIETVTTADDDTTGQPSAFTA